MVPEEKVHHLQEAGIMAEQEAESSDPQVQAQRELNWD